MNVPVHRSRSGAAIVFIFFILVVTLILAAYAINLAHIQLVRTEMQVATDASTRAASKVFTSSGDWNQALAAAQSLANQNLVNSNPLQLSAGDFTPGTATRVALSQRYHYQPGGTSPNALRLKVEKKPGAASGPVVLAFPMLGGQAFSQLAAESVVTQVELDIALVVDRSGSMAYAANEIAAYPPNPQAAPAGWQFGDPVPSPSRWLDTVDAVQAFLSELKHSPQNERVTLVTYAGSAKVEHDLTDKYSLPIQALSNYSKSFASGATNISSAMQVAANQLTYSGASRPWAAKVLVVMTDGIQTEGYDPIFVAESIAAGGIMIFTITFSAEANQDAMRQVAAKGGGLHFHATHAAGLAHVFREVARNMPTVISH